MPYIARLCAVFAIAGATGLWIQDANAAPPAGFKSAPPKPPTITNIGHPIATTQQLSFWGVQTGGQQRRDRLRSKTGGTENFDYWPDRW